MNIPIDDELRAILEDIERQRLSLREWREEPSDMFQTDSYCGGFDAIEDEFAFSLYVRPNEEYWFQFSLDDVKKAISSEITCFSGRPADKP